MTTSSALARPLPVIPVNVRVGRAEDLPFIDGLQKQHTRQVGWMPRQQLEGKIASGQVLVADDTSPSSSLTSDLRPLTSLPSSLAGYVISSDRYMKREDVGIVYQMNVAPSRQRGLVGATLLRAVFERAAYGCRLFCCWCAQDIAANRFWEAMGFVPLAFRAGSAAKSRVHIFWQRRVHAGDVATPWWFPSQTTSGSIREDRIVLPIPPGTHWGDAKPMVLPGESAVDRPDGQPSQLEGPRPKRARTPKAPPPAKPQPARRSITRTSQMWFAAPAPAPAPAAVEKPPRQKKPKARNDPKLVAAARELRDRWLERVNGEGSAAGAVGKYDVSRPVDGPAVAARRLVLVPQSAAGATPAFPGPAAA